VAITRPEQGYSLNTFFNYAESPTTLNDEIKADVYRVIKQTVTSSFYNRGEGSGIELLENETMSVEGFVLFTIQLLQNIGNYNATTSADRQIAFDADSIEVGFGTELGSMSVNFRYIPVKDLRPGASFTSLSVPVG
jgi:hypothetical protein